MSHSMNHCINDTVLQYYSIESIAIDTIASAIVILMFVHVYKII